MIFRLNKLNKNIFEEYFAVNFPKNDDFKFKFKGNFFEISSAVLISDSNLTYEHIKELEQILNANHKMIVGINNIRRSYFQFKNLDNLRLSKNLEKNLLDYIFKVYPNLKDFNYYFKDYSIFLFCLNSHYESKLSEMDIKFIENLLNVEFSIVIRNNNKCYLQFDFNF